MPSSVYILATLPAILIPVIAADVVTIALGSGDAATTRLGQVVGSSGSLTSYVIEDIPGTMVAGASTHYQTWRYPDGDLMSQGCSVVASSVNCKVYMSDADTGSTMVSSVPASLLTDAGDLVVSITATNTGAHPETTVKTVTDTTTPASTTAEITGSGKATVTSTPTGDGGFTLTGERAVEATSSGAAAGLVRDGSWIGGVLAVVLAAF